MDFSGTVRVAQPTSFPAPAWGGPGSQYVPVGPGERVYIASGEHTLKTVPGMEKIQITAIAAGGGGGGATGTVAGGGGGGGMAGIIRYGEGTFVPGTELIITIPAHVSGGEEGPGNTGDPVSVYCVPDVGGASTVVSGSGGGGGGKAGEAGTGGGSVGGGLVVLAGSTIVFEGNGGAGEVGSKTIGGKGGAGAGDLGGAGGAGGTTGNGEAGMPYGGGGGGTLAGAGKSGGKSAGGYVRISWPYD